MRAFDIVVVEPAHDLDPAGYREQNAGQSELFAYLSVGEVGRERRLPVPMPADMLLGTNAHWQSRYVEPSHPDWPDYFVEHLVAPLWSQGYRGFFLDTLDAYQALPGDPAKRAAREAALVGALHKLKARFPEARLIANRGFELLPRIHPLLMAVAAESLYGRWNVAGKTYDEVPAADREWLLGQFRQARKMGLQTLAIDYADPARRDAQAAMAARIISDGVTPYVTDGDLLTVGTGRIEVRPRTLLVVHNGTQKGDEQFSTAQEVIAMPLHYLGYRVELLDVNRHDLPTGPMADRYAGIVGVFEKDITNQGRQWVDLLGRALDERVPVVLLNSFGAPIADLPPALGIGQPDKPALGPLTLAQERRPLTSFETPALPDLRSVFVTAPAGADSLVRVRDRRGQVTDGVALTDWGGYALQPFTYNIHSDGMNWVINPIEFFRRALQRPDMPPVADVSTETGRRLLMVHIDGDGFASRAEIPGAPFAAEVMQKDFIARYKVPHTVSVIEGETGPQGLYPALSPVLERIARNIFKLDHVEIATHSYSHPFFWNKLVAEAASGTLELFPEKPVSLPIKNYRFSLEREVAGSASYIDERLAPPGKRTQVFLWTGDCVPPAAAIAATERAGLLNMNGGDTTISRQYPTLTRVAPMSLRKDGLLQVYAPNQNENVYTNDWTGPFYGFERVIETFEMTEAPLRLKPINIYYHTYAASKTSSIKAPARRVPVCAEPAGQPGLRLRLHQESP
ncbi:MAG: endo alpha-1,4 polygalactosaminidase [Burkholderiaceae bacterium]